MRAEVLPGKDGTLTVSFDLAELGVEPGSDAEARLTDDAGKFAGLALEAAGSAPEPAPPRSVDAVDVRFVRVLVCKEATVPLDQPREVWA